MGITPATLNRAIAAARKLETEGFFERVREGNRKAGSLFARLVAFELNPDGHADDFGWLSKSPGETQVDGFAEDAIVYGNDPDDRENVIDLITGAGAAGASVGGGIKPRRENNRWVKPEPLTAEQLKFLRPGPPPPPPRPPEPILPDRREMIEAGAWLDQFYRSPEGLQRPQGLSNNGVPDWEGVGAWLFDVYLKARVAGKSPADSRQAVVTAIQKTDEWKAKH
jgi:hypothetical protein